MLWLSVPTTPQHQLVYLVSQVIMPEVRYVASEGQQFEQVIMERESPEATAPHLFFNVSKV